MTSFAALCRRLALLTVGILWLFHAPAVFAGKPITVATGPAGGVYHPLGCVIAELFEKNIPNLTAVCEGSAGSAENIRNVVAGKADIAFAQADTVWDGYKGFGNFETPQPIRAVAVVYPNSLQVVVRAGSDIAKVSDLRNRRVSMGAKGSGTEIWGGRLLLAVGIDPDKDIQRISLGLTESVNALKEGRIDAFVWSGGVPTKAISDLAKELPIRLLNTIVALPVMLRKHGPVYTYGDIPPATYAGVVRSVKVAQVWNLLIAKTDADETLVYRMTKTLFERQSDLVGRHPEGRNLELPNQARSSPIPFHTGAKKYYAEAGLGSLR